MTKWLKTIEEGSFLFYLISWFGILFAIFLGFSAIACPIVFAESLPVWLIILTDVLLISGTAFCITIPNFLMNR